MDFDLSQYMDMYVDGSRENLDMMDKMLLTLEQQPENSEAVQEIFRAAHTLKGMSATMGFDKVAQLTHEMENILDKLRNKQLPVDQAIIDLLFETFDVLRVLVNDTISATDSNVDLEGISSKIKAACEGKAKRTGRSAEPAKKEVATAPVAAAGKPAAAGASSDPNADLADIVINEFENQVLLEAQGKGVNILLMKVALVPDCLLKAPRAFMVVRNLEEIACDILKSIPDTKDLEEEKFDLTFKMVLIGKASPAKVKDAIESISEIDKVEVRLLAAENFRQSATVPPPNATPSGSAPATAPSAATAPARPTPPPPTAAAPTAPPVARSLAPAAGAAQAPPPPPARPAGPAASAPSAGPAAATATAPARPPGATAASASGGGGAGKPGAAKPAHEQRASQTVRVDMRRLDELMNLVGELVVNRARLHDISAIHKLKDLNEVLARVSQISQSLQGVVMEVRMVPIEQVFDRFPRMVRDLSRKLNKKIDLVIEGKETEMDRTVIDEIGDPMVHLIRNSIDHGIESPQDRIAQGKPETGTIRLSAHHEGNHVIIEVRDDGKGIDPVRVGDLAVKRGLFTREQIDAMPMEDVQKIIFLAGFSTADQVSDLSGRGVGMDAVKTKLDELNGQLDIDSRVGEGTRVIIKLPLTLAILQALLVKLSNEMYAIPLGSVQETMDITSEDITIVQHQEVTLLRGEVLPIIRLRGLLDVPTAPDEKEREEISIVVCSSGEKRAGFMVDELLGQQEIVIKSLGNLLASLPGIMGATMLGDGRVALILDIPSFFQAQGGKHK